MDRSGESLGGRSIDDGYGSKRVRGRIIGLKTNKNKEGRERRLGGMEEEELNWGHRKIVLIFSRIFSPNPLVPLLKKCKLVLTRDWGCVYAKMAV